jgi:hypothetical protein
VASAAHRLAGADADVSGDALSGLARG